MSTPMNAAIRFTGLAKPGRIAQLELVEGAAAAKNRDVDIAEGCVNPQRTLRGVDDRAMRDAIDPQRDGKDCQQQDATDARGDDLSSGPGSERVCSEPRDPH